MKKGDEYSYRRAFSREEILDFAELSQDKGVHHVRTDARLMAHGLLTASLATKLGGDLNFIAAKMAFEFLRPVYEGDTVECRVKVESIVEQSRRTKCGFSFRFFNQNGELVLTGTSSGMIWRSK